MTEEIGDDWAKFLANQTLGALQDAAQIARLRDPGFIAEGTPKSIPGKVVQGASRQACRRYADDPGSVRQSARVKAESACRPYLDALGYGIAGSVKPPFTGGQCAGVGYKIEAEIWNPTLGVWTNPQTIGLPSGLAGPIRSITPVELASCSVSGNPGNRTRVDVVYGPNSLTANNGANPACRPRENGTGPVFRNFRAVRSDGLPDTCGNPPSEITDPVPPVVPGPPVERFNPSPDIDVDIGVRINPDGTIDVDFGTGDITIDPFGDGAAPVGGGPAPGDVGGAAAPSEVEGGQAAEGEAPPGKVLTGLKVDILGGEERLSKYTEDVRRAVGYFYMGVPGLLDQDFGGSMLRSGQFLLAEKDNLTAWRAVANIGIRLRVTPYYREVE